MSAPSIQKNSAVRDNRGFRLSQPKGVCFVNYELGGFSVERLSISSPR
jgi:hypothetical protein